ncbi:MAG: cytochrome c nitrite reductase small subunit [Acidobacteria bacterium]|nr:cytochrome c nitrite reductase small subunit [Acidobacteriota bacterium]
MSLSKTFKFWISLFIGLIAGIGFYTFIYAKGFSYLSDDPSSCANCHVMNEQYDAWIKSSHHAVAVCNDCHTPEGFIPKYTVKGLNGFNHSWAFTTGWYEDPIQIKDMNRQVTENACRKCHEDFTIMVDRYSTKTNNAVQCLDCHSSVGHLH